MGGQTARHIGCGRCRAGPSKWVKQRQKVPPVKCSKRQRSASNPRSWWGFSTPGAVVINTRTISRASCFSVNASAAWHPRTSAHTQERCLTLRGSRGIRCQPISAQATKYGSPWPTVSGRVMTPPTSIHTHLRDPELRTLVQSDFDNGVHATACSHRRSGPAVGCCCGVVDRGTRSVECTQQEAHRDDP